MQIHAISDLHLSLSVDKPMDIFGERWSNYMERLREEWKATVNEGDYVIIPGDISWATYLDEAVADFRFIDELPGKKIISKGNHDYWWTTANKLSNFKEKYSFKSIEFMHNNCFDLGEIILCGTRGWQCPGDEGFEAEDYKIYLREIQRLELSLKSIPKGRNGEIYVSLHYPPFNSQRQPSDFVNIMKEYGVRKCIYGHLHGYSFKNAFQGDFEGIEFSLVSADYLNFKPIQLKCTPDDR